MEAQSLKQFRVLVIDDDISILNSIQRQLRKEPMLNCDFINNPVRAVEMARESSFDLVISDVRMEPISGIEVLKQVKTSCRGIPVVILTGFFDEQITGDARRFGADLFLLKPVRKKELLKAIYSLLKIDGKKVILD